MNVTFPVIWLDLLRNGAGGRGFEEPEVWRKCYLGINEIRVTENGAKCRGLQGISLFHNILIS